MQAGVRSWMAAAGDTACRATYTSAWSQKPRAQLTQALLTLSYRVPRLLHGCAQVAVGCGMHLCQGCQCRQRPGRSQLWPTCPNRSCGRHGSRHLGTCSICHPPSHQRTCRGWHSQRQRTQSTWSAHGANMLLETATISPLQQAQHTIKIGEPAHVSTVVYSAQAHTSCAQFQQHDPHACWLWPAQLPCFCPAKLACG
jgi:hypothetical protein